MLKTKLISMGIFTFLGVSYAQPVTFYNALNLALNTLDEINLARAVRDTTKLDTERLVAELKPTLSLSVDASNRFTGGLESVNRDGNASSATLSGRWTAYTFGREELAYENALIDEKNADLTYYKTETSVIKTIINTYFSLIELRRQYETQLQSEKSAESAMIRDNINFQNGTLSESVKLNSQAKFARIKATRIGLEVQLSNIEQEFERIVGFKAPENLPIPDLSKVSLPASLDMAIEQAFVHNPDLKILINNRDKLKNTLASEHAERKGTVTLSASSRKNIIDGGELNNTINLQYNITFDVNKSNRLKTEKTTLNLGNNAIRLKVEQNTVRNTLRQFWQVYVTQKNLLDANLITVQANKVAVETEQVKYNAGQSTSDALLEKIEAEINATQQYVTGLKQYALAIVDILTITGNMTVDKFSDL